jgi:hypothetical protein
VAHVSRPCENAPDLTPRTKPLFAPEPGLLHVSETAYQSAPRSVTNDPGMYFSLLMFRHNAAALFSILEADYRVVPIIGQRRPYAALRNEVRRFQMAAECREQRLEIGGRRNGSDAAGDQHRFDIGDASVCRIEKRVVECIHHGLNEIVAQALLGGRITGPQEFL